MAVNWTKYASNPVLDLGAGGTWDDAHLDYPFISFDGSTYKMWYSGYDGSNWRIGYATSSDGITWSKYGSNPVMDFGTGWENAGVWSPRIILDGSTYKMWYVGYNNSNYRIGYATSSDGISWSKYGSNPVITVGAGGTWDDAHVAYSTVILDGSTYKMWYAGHDGSTWKIGYATSSDGISWSKSGSNPVLSLGAGGTWDDVHVGYPFVIKDGGTYKMWYTGNDGTNYRIGYATSSDGIAWTKYASNPVLNLGTSGSWDDAHLGTIGVIFDGVTYKGWFGASDGTNYRIGYATSPDGMRWHIPVSQPYPVKNEVVGY